MLRLRAIALIGLLGATAPPLLKAQTLETFTFTTNRFVPDGDAAGLSDARTINSAIGTITAIKVRLKLTGEFNGDTYAYLRHASGFTVLLNRSGKTDSSIAGYGDSGFDVTLQTDASNGDIHNYRNVTTPADGSPLTGTWEPDGRGTDPATVTDGSPRTSSLTNFNGLSAAGQWTLYLADVESGGTNMLTEWELQIIGAASPTIAWPNPADIVYGTALGGSQLNATAAYNSTPVSGTFTYTPPSGTVLNAGPGQTLSVTFTPDNSSSYLPVTTTVAVNVTKAPLTITANDTNKVYGAGLPGFTASYGGFVNGDTASSLTAPVTLGTGATSANPIGTYAITAANAISSNYNIAFTAGTLTVTAAPLTITANDTNKLYGADAPGFTASYSGFVNGDTASSLATPVTLGTAAGIASPVGTYPITATNAAGSNYNIAFVSGTLTVNPVTITVTANNKSKAFGAALPELTATYSGFVLSQGTNDLAALATLSTTATPSSNVGTYPITAANAASPNYNFTYVGGTLNVTQSLTLGNLVSSANPALPGANVTFTLTLSAGGSGVGTPTGNVNFRIDGGVAGSIALSGGIATFALTTLSHGSHTVVAEYAGNQNFIGVTNTLTPVQAINTPPVANNDTVERYPTQGVKVRLAALLAKASDGDNDTLAITVSSTSANAGSITASDGWVFYTAASGFTNADSFTYTVTDGHGGSATGTITVAIKVDGLPGQNLAITDLGGGSFRIDGNGIPGRAYRLQYTDTLTPATWQDLEGATVTTDSVGRFQYTGTSGSGSRYYRSVYP